MFSVGEDVEANALFKRGWTVSAIARHLESLHLVTGAANGFSAILAKAVGEAFAEELGKAGKRLSASTANSIRTVRDGITAILGPDDPKPPADDVHALLTSDPDLARGYRKRANKAAKKARKRLKQAAQ